MEPRTYTLTATLPYERIEEATFLFLQFAAAGESMSAVAALNAYENGMRDYRALAIEAEAAVPMDDHMARLTITFDGTSLRYESCGGTIATLRGQRVTVTGSIDSLLWRWAVCPAVASADFWSEGWGQFQMLLREAGPWKALAMGIRSPLAGVPFAPESNMAIREQEQAIACLERHIAGLQSMLAEAKNPRPHPAFAPEEGAE